MSLGLTALMLTVSSNNAGNSLVIASLLIIVAALIDRFDGKIARKLNASSELGKELDSLSDLISFGVAPSVITWVLSFSGFGILGYLLCLVFPIAGAYRLARFNVTVFDNIYTGVPITIAGSFLTLINIYYTYAKMNDNYYDAYSIGAVVLVIALSYLMVSKIKIKKM